MDISDIIIYQISLCQDSVVVLSSQCIPLFCQIIYSFGDNSSNRIGLESSRKFLFRHNLVNIIIFCVSEYFCFDCFIACTYILARLGYFTVVKSEVMSGRQACDLDLVM